MSKPIKKRRRYFGSGLSEEIRSPCINVKFGEELFHRIQGEAARRQLSLSAVVREKIEQMFQIEDEISTGVVESGDNSVELKKEGRTINVIHPRSQI